jgi:hypothetical protein
MTHTNHRQGTYESLAKDFVVMVMPAKGYNDDADAPRKLREALSIYLAHNAVNAGAVKGGLLVTDTPEEMASVIGQDTPMIHGAFNNPDDVLAVLKELKQRDLGLSVVVSGVVSEVENIAREGGLTPHSIEYSLGIMGKTDLLCDPVIRPLCTMCGHGLISPAMAESVVDDVASGSIDAAQGACLLSKHCVCGVFNLKRAEELIEQAVDAIHKKGERP